MRDEMIDIARDITDQSELAPKKLRAKLPSLKKSTEQSVALPENILVGTSAFTAEGWVGSFYPAGMQPRDFLSYYATKFNTVELDNTFYRTPAISTVEGWNLKTPPGFIFAAKVPQVITHEKVLVDCEGDLTHFLKTMDTLGDKAQAAPLSVRLLQQIRVQERIRIHSEAESLPAKTSQGIQVRDRDSEQELDGRSLYGLVAREWRGDGPDRSVLGSASMGDEREIRHDHCGLYLCPLARGSQRHRGGNEDLG